MRTTGDELPGIAALADRPVDGRRVALVMGAVALALSLACAAQIEQLLGSANDEPEAARLLRAHPAEHLAGPRLTDRLAIVVIDGMRVDEARRLSAWRELAPRSVTGELALETPTLSRPFYHQLFTGVPHDASGVRSNRFGGRARLDSLTDRVRAAGGSVAFVAENLDWMRRMHGRPGDAGSDDALSVEPGSLAAHLRAFSSARAPALLVVHFTSTDHTAHHGGIDSAAHRSALERAGEVIERVASAAPVLFVMSDHGHLAAGGHGGPEPRVARSPLLVRAPGVSPRALGEPTDPKRLAATFAAWLGVPAPSAALGAPSDALLPRGAARGDAHYSRLASIAAQGRASERHDLQGRQRLALLFALLASLMMLGPIRRAYGFDRAVPIAIAAWPASVIALHLALDRPLSFSAIDGVFGHGVRVTILGVIASLVALALSRVLARRGDGRARTRRVAASVGWSALACALLANAWVGFALGPWPLSPHASYLALLSAGAGAPALAVIALVLLASALAERRPSSDGMIHAA